MDEPDSLLPDTITPDPDAVGEPDAVDDPDTPEEYSEPEEECPDPADPCSSGPYDEPTPVATCPLLYATRPVASPIDTHLAWTGSEYAVAYMQRGFAGSEEPLSFSRIDGGGRLVAETSEPISEGRGGFGIVWSGSTFGVAWVTEGESGSNVSFKLLDALGEGLGPEVMVSTSEAVRTLPSPGVLWTGDSFVVTWLEMLDSPSNVFFSVLDAGGAVVWEATALTDNPSSIVPCTPPHDHAVWTGSQVGLVYWSTDYSEGGPEVDLVTFQPGGGSFPAVPRRMAGLTSPAIAWSGSQIIVVSERIVPSEQIVVERFAPSGMFVGDGVVVSGGSSSLAIAWTTDRMGLLWMDDELDFAIVDEAGEVRSAVLGIEREATPARLDAVWTGSEFGITWSEVHSDMVELMFARIVVCEP